MNLEQSVLPTPVCPSGDHAVRAMTLMPGAPIDVDVAIVGSGFGGSLAALALLKRGHRVALVERGRHPRFAIGESSTPLANLRMLGRS